METQRAVILNHLKTKGTITSKEAFNLYGATRLSAVIFDLRQSGYLIDTVDTFGKNRFGHTCCYATYVYRGDPYAEVVSN